LGIYWANIAPINYVTRGPTVDSHGIFEFHKRDIFSNEVMIVWSLQTQNIWRKDSSVNEKIQRRESKDVKQKCRKQQN